MLPLLFFPNPKEIERRESIDCLGWSCCPTRSVMLTGGYLFGLDSSAAGAFRFPPKIEFVLLKIPPIVFDLLCPLPGLGSYSPDPPIPANLAAFGGTWLALGLPKSDCSFCTIGSEMLYFFLSFGG